MLDCMLVPHALEATVAVDSAVSGGRVDERIQPLEIGRFVGIHEELDLVKETAIDGQVLLEIAVEDVDEHWPSICAFGL